jgi:hypothetical protein
MLMIFFDIKRSARKEFALIGQAVNSAYYSDVLWRLRENVRRLRHEIWRKKELVVASHQIFFFHMGIFDQNNIRLPLTVLSSVYPIEDETKRPPF